MTNKFAEAGAAGAQASCERIKDHPNALAVMMIISHAMASSSLTVEEVKMVRHEALAIIDGFLAIVEGGSK